MAADMASFSCLGFAIRHANGLAVEAIATTAGYDEARLGVGALREAFGGSEVTVLVEYVRC